MSQPTRIPTKALFLFLVLVMLFLSGGGRPVVQAQGGTPPELFSQVAAPADAGPLEQGEVRSAYVKVDMGLLFDASGKARDRETLPEIKLNLFPDLVHVGVVTRVKKDLLGTYWVGRLKGQGFGNFSITVVDGVFIAHIIALNGTYHVEWENENLYKVTQIDSSQLKQDAPRGIGVSKTVQTKFPTSNSLLTPKIDVMILYTDDARVAAGGGDKIWASIVDAVERTNDSYANSGVLTRLRLVHSEEIAFNESGDFIDDWNRLKNLSQVKTMRDRYGADMVSLIINSAQKEYCGLYNGNFNKEEERKENAFTVVKRSCLKDFTLAHEFGHVQGAHHDVYAVNINNEHDKVGFSYGHGFVGTKVMATVKLCFYTIMAYPTECVDKYKNYYHKPLSLWSNPNRKYFSVPLGVVGESENYRVLNETAGEVAGYWETKVSDDFFSDFGIRYGGWSAVSGNWKIANGTYSTGTDGYFNSVKHTGKYVDFKYEAMLKRTVAKYNANNIIVRGDTSSLSGAKEWKSEYAFQYSNDGTFSVWKTDKNGTKTPLKPWTAHSAIRPYNWNKLTVYAIGNRFTFLINNKLVWSGIDASLTGGEVGIGRWDIESRSNEFLIDWAKLTNDIYTDVVADSLVDQEIIPGVELSGGTIDSSPHR